MGSVGAALSSKNQIVIPKEAREALGVKPGGELLAAVRGKTLTVLRKPKSFSKTIEGLAKGLYPTGYLKKERRVPAFETLLFDELL